MENPSIRDQAYKSSCTAKVKPDKGELSGRGEGWGINLFLKETKCRTYDFHTYVKF